MLKTTHHPPSSSSLAPSTEAAARGAARIAELLPQLRSRKGRIDRNVLQELQTFPEAVPGLIAAIDLKRRQRLSIGHTIIVEYMSTVGLYWLGTSVLKSQLWHLFVLAWFMRPIIASWLPKPDDDCVVRALLDIEDVFV